MQYLSRFSDFGFESMHSCSVQISGVHVSKVFRPQVFDVCFFIVRTFEPSAFAGFRGSLCRIFRAFGVSGFLLSWVSGFRPSGFCVFDACFSSL